jgi:hypothetical protein
VPGDEKSETVFYVEMDTDEALSVEGALRVVASFGGSFGVSAVERKRCGTVADRIQSAIERAATVAAPDDKAGEKSEKSE